MSNYNVVSSYLRKYLQILTLGDPQLKNYPAILTTLQFVQELRSHMASVLSGCASTYEPGHD